ncbi:MAG: hypothetical protein HY052_06395, partial [Proteobacteria bacterium]|nr:hypothetical protein [Pseudomonadota bacterium]
ALLQDIGTDKDYIKNISRGVYYHPGVTLAVAEVFGEVSAWEGFWAMRKTEYGWIKVNLVDCDIEIPEHLAVTNKSLMPVDVCIDYNIIFYEGIYYGVRQSLGEVNLTVGQETLFKQYHEGDIFSGSSVNEIRMHIVFHKYSSRVTEIIDTLTNKLSENSENVAKMLNVLKGLREELNSLEKFTSSAGKLEDMKEKYVG